MMMIDRVVASPVFVLWQKVQQTVLLVLMLVAVVYCYQPEKSVMAYLEYLPVYRVELRWEKEGQQIVVSPSEAEVVVGQK